MRVILLHGPGEVGKRSEALRVRKQFMPEAVTVVDFKTDAVEKLELALTSVSLFENGPRLVVLENAPEKLDLNKLSRVDDNTTLLVMAGILKSTSSLFQTAQGLKAKTAVFEGEKELSAFPFLDNLIEQKKQALLELEKLLTEYGGMYVLSMIYYLLRRNLLPPPTSSFVRQKIARQKRRLEPHDWERFYRLTLKTEFNIKSGKIPEGLALTRLTQEIIGV